MKVSYIHTFTVTVEGSDNFVDATSLEKAIEYGQRDAGHVKILVQRGGLEPKIVRSQVETRTVFVHEDV